MVSLLIFQSCTKHKPSLERSKFVDITAELYMAEVLAANKDTAMTAKKEYFKSYQQDVFKKYGCDSGMYYQSYEAYNEQIDTMQSVMNDVISKLTIMQAAGMK